MKKIWTYITFSFVFLIVMQVNGSDSDSNRTTPQIFENNSFGQSGCLGISTDSMLLSPTSPKKRVDDSCRDLPITPVAKRPTLKVGSFEEIEAYENAKHQRSEENVLMRQRRELLAIRTLTPQEKEILLQRQKYRQAKELRENRTAAGCCVCCFLGLVLLSDFSTNLTSCNTVSCLPSTFKQKMS